MSRAVNRADVDEVHAEFYAAFEAGDLTIPHPRLVERPFVLVPLAEIAPDLVPPGYADTVASLATRVRGQGDVLARVAAIDLPDASSDASRTQ